VACALLRLFIAWRVHPPQPFWGRVTSTIQCGSRNAVADDKKAFQSARLRGETSLVPSGQLFLSFDLHTFKHFMHFKSLPAENEPVAIWTSVHVQPDGLPDFGDKDTFFVWQ